MTHVGDEDPCEEVRQFAIESGDLISRRTARPARFETWAKSLTDHPEATEPVLDAFYRNFYGPGFVHSVDRAFVSSCRTPCLVLAGNDEAHPFPISEEVAKLLPNAEFITEWKTGAALAAAKPRIKEFLSKHTS